MVAGLSSGLDWRSIVDQLIAVDRRAVDLVESRKTEYEQKLQEWQSFNGKLLALKTAAEDLKDPEGFQIYTPRLSSDDSNVDPAGLLSVTASSSASKGSYAIIVDTVARAQKLSSQSFSNVSEPLGASYAGDIVINGTTITVEATDSLSSLRNKINNANAGTNPTGVSASIVSYATNDNRLILTSDTTGAEGIEVQNGSGLVLVELVAGADASLRIDGVTVTSSDNTVSDVLPGVTLNLLKADVNTTITLAIDHDLDAIMEKIENFVSAYNTVTAYIKQQQTYDQEEGKTGGVLFGDGTLSSVKSDLTASLIQQVWGVSSELSTLGLMGVNLDNQGQLSVDEDRVREFLETRFNDVARLFAATGESDAGSLEYVSHSRDTASGDYEVTITQAAAQSTTTSIVAVSGTLTADETLTLTEGTRTATVELTAGMSLSDIINAVNTELDTVYTETLAGSAALTAGGNPITSSTTWASIDGANLADGDTISFTGTARNGQSVSGSHEISDASSDTVQGLLSAVEAAFGNAVEATIDSSGRLVLTDQYEGDSNLSLSFDYAEAHNLDFGALSASNPGGQEGRYAMAITASSDEGNHVVLTHDVYGSSHTFTVEEDTDAGLWTGSQTNPVTVNNGADVAGTINGKAATGLAQVLTGDDGETGVEGLVVKYTGSSTGTVGTVTLTLGIAEIFERSLYSITDPYAGYLTFKQDSLQDSIDGFEGRIAEMEDRLNHKMERMINQFVAMELALARIQSQSQWLQGQITASYSGWGSL
jgi:flagellar hook-associated protein 2